MNTLTILLVAGCFLSPLSMLAQQAPAPPLAKQTSVSSHSNGRVQTADSLFEAGKFEQAATAYLDAIFDDQLALSKDYKASLYAKRSRCFVALKLDSIALDDASMVIGLQPNAETFYERANIYVRLRLLVLAMKDIESALSLMPDNPWYYLLRGSISFQRGEMREACADIGMARLLGLSVPEDIASATCKTLGIPIEELPQSTGASVKEQSAFKAASTGIASEAVQSLISQTNNLNTTYYKFFIQAGIGSSTAMLSRFFYDVGRGTVFSGSLGYGLSREFTLWCGAVRSAFPYTYASERSQLAGSPGPPYGEVVSWAGVVGGQYSAVVSNKVDVQLSIGLGYRSIRYPIDAPIVMTNGSIRRANLGVAESSGLLTQTIFGVEWRFLKQLAFVAQGGLDLAFSRYNFLTIQRIDREDTHQFLNISAGLRLYLFEQDQ